MGSTITASVLLLMEQATVPPSAPPVPPPPPPIRMYPAPPAPPAPPAYPAKRARPLAQVASLISDRDYPRAALRANQQGTVGFTLQVDPDGQVAGCSVTRPSGSTAIDAATCAIMQSRARFEPARNALGTPVPDRYSARIAWRINRRLNQPFAPLLIIEEMRADASGAITCTSAINGRARAPKPCPAGPNSAGLASLARAQGKPLALSAVVKLIPEGMAEPADGASRGDRFRASDALLTVGADGSFRACRVTRNEWLGGGNSGVPPSPCLDWYPGMKLYVRARKGSPARTVRVTVRGHAEHPWPVLKSRTN